MCINSYLVLNYRVVDCTYMDNNVLRINPKTYEYSFILYLNAGHCVFMSHNGLNTFTAFRTPQLDLPST